MTGGNLSDKCHPYGRRGGGGGGGVVALCWYQVITVTLWLPGSFQVSMLVRWGPAHSLSVSSIMLLLPLVCVVWPSRGGGGGGQGRRGVMEWVGWGQLFFNRWRPFSALPTSCAWRGCGALSASSAATDRYRRATLTTGRRWGVVMPPIGLPAQRARAIPVVGGSVLRHGRHWIMSTWRPAGVNEDTVI